MVARGRKAGGRWSDLESVVSRGRKGCVGSGALGGGVGLFLWISTKDHRH